VSADLDELYFEWLYSQVASVKLKQPSRTYWNLFRILFTHEFVWIEPNDDNRVEDGKDLRYEFLDEKAIRCDDQAWLDEGCSMLELIIGLSRRAAFESSATQEEWFWEMLENLDLSKYNDRERIPEDEVRDILNRVIFRAYKRNGSGGLFPLHRAQRDLRYAELWYQLNAYILERT